MVGARSYKYPGGPAKHWFAHNPRQHVFCLLQIDNTMVPNVKLTRNIAHLCKIKGSQIFYVPPNLSIFLQNKLCYICKKTLFHFSSRFDFWHHGRRLANRLIKPMLRWTPGVFITPGTYHTSKIKYMFCDVKFCARLQIRRDYFHPYMFMYRNIFFCGPPL